MSYQRVRGRPPIVVRPKVEELEPKVLPDAGGAWRALVQNAKQANQALRAARDDAANLEDPFCAGVDPGPCATPDVVRLRADIYQALADLRRKWNDAEGDETRAMDYLNDLEHDPNARQGDILNAEVAVEFYRGRLRAVGNDLERVGQVASTDDNHLYSWAAGMSANWRDTIADAIDTWKEFKNDLSNAIRGRRPFGECADLEKNVYFWRGTVTQAITDYNTFVYYVYI